MNGILHTIDEHDLTVGCLYISFVEFFFKVARKKDEEECSNDVTNNKILEITCT